LQNIDSFLQTLLGLEPADLGLDPVAGGVERMRFAIDSPIVGTFPSPIPLRLLVISMLFFLPTALTETFLFSVAVFFPARLLAIPQTGMGMKPLTAPSTLPLRQISHRSSG
jgi:hypothetical protein